MESVVRASRDPIGRLAPSLLLALPDPCLLAVLRCCAVDDQRSLFSAARAHSRLHQAAVLAACSIRAATSQQKQLESCCAHVSKHGQHVNTISIIIPKILPLPFIPIIPRKPQKPQDLPLLTRLEQGELRQQLQQRQGGQAVLANLIRILKCRQLQDLPLLNDDEGLEAVLTRMPKLQHLSINNPGRSFWLFRCSDVLQRLQHLTHLELGGCSLFDPLSLQHLTGLTKLQELRLAPTLATITASMLAGLQLLTRLDIGTGVGTEFEPAVLEGKSNLQHLGLKSARIVKTSSMGQLLSHLQDLQQMTCLSLARCREGIHSIPPAAAYAALTASSKLQHLDISQWELTEGAWKDIFPKGRRLPHLRTIVAKGVREQSWGSSTSYPAVAPFGDNLASCCPGLASLKLEGLAHYGRELPALQELSGLRELHLLEGVLKSKAMDELCKLTGLQGLHLGNARGYQGQAGVLLRLTQLQQLTELKYGNLWHETAPPFHLQQGPGDEPVWRQLLRHHLNHNDPTAGDCGTGRVTGSSAVSGPRLLAASHFVVTTVCQVDCFAQALAWLYAR